MMPENKRMAALQQFYEQDPADPFNLYALTLEHLAAHDGARARAGFEKLLAEFPDYVPTYYHAAAFFAQAGEQQQAIAIFEQGLNAARHDAHALRELRGAYQRWQDEWDD